MRITTGKILAAFLERRAAKVGRHDESDGRALYLFGNQIAEWRGSELWITDAGWPTATTADRLDSLTYKVARLHINRRGSALFLDGKEIPRREWIRVA